MMQIIVTVKYAAIHNWPGVVNHIEYLPDVQYLQHPHRHVFHIKVSKEVFHDDRDVEIIDFKGRILKYLDSTYSGQLGSKSCEMLALELTEEFSLCSCEVLEDGENGALYVL